MYSCDDTRLALDLAIFINGLPVITCELKNQFTKQNADDAVQQYKTDRSPPVVKRLHSTPPSRFSVFRDSGESLDRPGFRGR